MCGVGVGGEGGNNLRKRVIKPKSRLINKEIITYILKGDWGCY